MATVNVTERRDLMLHEWVKLDGKIKHLKKQELELREKLVKEFSSKDKIEGSETIELGNDYKLRVKKTLRYNLDSKHVKEALTKINDPDVVERLVSWKPSLSVREYKQLNKDHKKSIDSVLEIKPGTPSLEIVVPK